MQIRPNQYQNHPSFGMALKVSETVVEIGELAVKQLEKELPSLLKLGEKIAPYITVRATPTAIIIWT